MSDPFIRKLEYTSTYGQSPAHTVFRHLSCAMHEKCNEPLYAHSGRLSICSFASPSLQNEGKIAYIAIREA
jgi:hypothetical protein